MATYDDILNGRTDDEGPTPPEPERPPPIIGRRKRRADDDATGMIRRIGKEEGAPVDLLLAMAGQEGGRISTPTSGAGAHGPLQVRRATGLRFVTPDEFDTVEGQVRAGARYVNFLGNKFGWDRPDLITAGYHAGEGAVERAGNQIPHRYDKEAKIWTADHVGLVMGNLKRIQGRQDSPDGGTDQDQDRGYYKPAIPVDLSPPGKKQPQGDTYDDIIKRMPAPKKGAVAPAAPTPTPAAPGGGIEYTEPYKTPEKAAETRAAEQPAPQGTWYDRLLGRAPSPPRETTSWPPFRGPQAQSTPHNVPPATATTPQAQPTPPAPRPIATMQAAPTPTPPARPQMGPTATPTPAPTPYPETMGAAPRPTPAPPEQPSLLGGIAQGVRGYLFPGAPPSRPAKPFEPWDVTGRPPTAAQQPTAAGTPPSPQAAPTPTAYTPQSVPPQRGKMPRPDLVGALSPYKDTTTGQPITSPTAEQVMGMFEGHPHIQSLIASMKANSQRGVADMEWLAGHASQLSPADLISGGRIHKWLAKEAFDDYNESNQYDPYIEKKGIGQVTAWPGAMMRYVPEAIATAGGATALAPLAPALAPIVGATAAGMAPSVLAGGMAYGAGGAAMAAGRGKAAIAREAALGAITGGGMSAVSMHLPSWMQSAEEIKAGYQGTATAAGGVASATKVAIAEAKNHLLTRLRAAGISGAVAAGASGVDQYFGSDGEISWRKMIDDGIPIALITALLPGLRTILKGEPVTLRPGEAPPSRPPGPDIEVPPDATRAIGPGPIGPEIGPRGLEPSPRPDFPQRIKGLLPPAGGMYTPGAKPVEPFGPGTYLPGQAPPRPVPYRPGGVFSFDPPGTPINERQGWQITRITDRQVFARDTKTGTERPFRRDLLTQQLGRDFEPEIEGGGATGTVLPPKGASQPVHDVNVTGGGGANVKGGGTGVVTITPVPTVREGEHPEAQPEREGKMPPVGQGQGGLERPDLPQPIVEGEMPIGGEGDQKGEKGKVEVEEPEFGPTLAAEEEEKEKKEAEAEGRGYGLHVPPETEGTMPPVGEGTAIPLPGGAKAPPGTEGPYEPTRPVSPMRPVEPVRPVSKYTPPAPPAPETPEEKRARMLREMKEKQAARTEEPPTPEGGGGAPVKEAEKEGELPPVAPEETPEQAKARKMREARDKILAGKGGGAAKAEEPVTPVSEGQPAGKDSEGRPVVAVPPAKLVSVRQSFSQQGLDFGTVSKPFNYNGQLYAMTGSQNVQGEQQYRAQKMVPVADWKDADHPPVPADLHDPANTGTDPTTGAPFDYHGRQVRHGGKDYVLEGPATVFRAIRPGESFAPTAPTAPTTPTAPVQGGQVPTAPGQPPAPVQVAEQPTTTPVAPTPVAPAQKEKLLDQGDAGPGKTPVETPKRTVGPNALWRLRNNYAEKVGQGDPQRTQTAAREFDRASVGARRGDAGAAQRLDDMIDHARGKAAAQPPAGGRERIMHAGDSQAAVTTPRRVIGPNALKNLQNAYARHLSGGGRMKDSLAAHRAFEQVVAAIHAGTPGAAERLDNMLDLIPKEETGGPTGTAPTPETQGGGVSGVLPGGGNRPGPVGGGAAPETEPGEGPAGRTTLPGTPGGPGPGVTTTAAEPEPGVPGPPGPTVTTGGQPGVVQPGGGGAAVQPEPTTTEPGGVPQPVTTPGEGPALGGGAPAPEGGATGGVQPKPVGVGERPDTTGEPVAETPAEKRARLVKELKDKVKQAQAPPTETSLRLRTEPRRKVDIQASRPRQPAVNWWLARPEPTMIPGVYEDELALPIQTPPPDPKVVQEMLDLVMGLIDSYFEGGVFDYDEIGTQIINDVGAEILFVASFYNDAWNTMKEIHSDKDIEEPGDFDDLLIAAGLKDPEKIEQQVTYVPRSQVGMAKAMPVLTPSNMAASTQLALDALERRRGQIDAFVAKEMGMTMAQMEDRFLPHQVDALGLMLDNFLRGSAFINGDATGMGKGRTVAAAIDWAVRHNIVPVFVTEKPGLYADMIRDLRDIGAGHLVPFITNNSTRIPVNDEAYEWEKAKDLAKEAGDDIPPVPAGAKFLNTPEKRKHETHMREMLASGTLKHGNDKYDVVFTTYDQLSPPQDIRHRFFAQFSNQGLLMLDESHNAGGTENAQQVPIGPNEPRAQFIRRVAQDAKAVLFSSATHAKRPGVMSLYARTDLSIALDMGVNLIDILLLGGVPLQQIGTVMLAEAGQLIRREHDLSGIEYQTLPIEVDKGMTDRASGAMRGINRFSGIVERLVRNMNRPPPGSPPGTPRPPQSRAHPFTDVMHNLVGQFLLGLKMEKLADEVIASAEKGEKPFVVLSNTMGSFLKEEATKRQAHVGDPMLLSFKDVFERSLEKARTITDALGQPHRLTDDELGPRGILAFLHAKATIHASGFDLPASPIDYLHMRFKEAGFKSGEITGRTTALEYKPVSPKLKGPHNHGSGVNVAPGRKYLLRDERDKSQELPGPQNQFARMAKVTEPTSHHETPKRIIHYYAMRALEQDLMFFERHNYDVAGVKLNEARDAMDADATPDNEERLKKAQAELDEARKVYLDRETKIRVAKENARPDNPDGDKGVALDKLIDQMERKTIEPTLRHQHQNTATKKLILSEYNNGGLDILVANRSAAAGLSAHAHFSVHDQRRRRMFIGQAEPNIDQFMQLLGRINRIGQVTEPNANHNKELKGVFGLPAYSQAAADIPLELRPSAMLERKMASLNANTTGARAGSATSKTAIDYINQYGDEIVADMLDEDPDLNHRLGDPVTVGGNGRHQRENAATKVTARFAFLPLEEQQRLDKEITDEYTDYIIRQKRMGNNVLEAPILNLKAKTDAIAALYVGDPTNGSPFARSAYLERADVNRLGKPPTSKEALQKLKEAAGLTGDNVTVEQIAIHQRRKYETEVIPKLREEAQTYMDEIDKEIEAAEAAGDVAKAAQRRLERQRVRTNLTFMVQLMSTFYPGRAVQVESSGGTLYGFVENIVKKKGGTSRNPAKPSGWTVHMLYADPLGHDAPAASKFILGGDEAQGRRMGIKPALYGFPKVAAAGGIDYIPMIQAFDTNRRASRHRRYIATGNIIRAFSRGARGQVMSFSDHTGAIRQGILLPPRFRPDTLVDEQPVFFETNDDLWKFMDAPRQGGEHPAVKTADDLLDFKWDRRTGEYQFDVPSAKKGAIYYGSYPILDVTGPPLPAQPIPPETKQPTGWVKPKGGSRMIFRTSEKDVARRLTEAIYNGAVQNKPMIFKVTEPTVERQRAREVLGIPPPGFSPVVPPEELPSRDIQPGFKRWREDGTIQTKYGPAKGRRIHGIVFGNERATMELQAIRKKLTGKDEAFGGININRYGVGVFIRAMNTILGTPGLSEEDIAGVTEMRDSFQTALDTEPDEPTISYLNADNIYTDEEIENIAMHEIGIHGWQENVGRQSQLQYRLSPDDFKQLIDPEWLQAHPMYNRILGGINARGYDPTVRMVSIESLSHILSGEWRLLGLNSFEEAARWIHDILLHIANRHGIWAIDQLAYYHPSFQGVVAGVKHEFSEVAGASQVRPWRPPPPTPEIYGPFEPFGPPSPAGPQGGGQAVLRAKKPGELSYATPAGPIWPDALARQLTGARSYLADKSFQSSALRRAELGGKESPQGPGSLEAGISQRRERRGVPGYIAAPQATGGRPHRSSSFALSGQPGAITHRWNTPHFDYLSFVGSVTHLTPQAAMGAVQDYGHKAAADIQAEIHTVGTKVGTGKFKEGLPVPILVGNAQMQFWFTIAMNLADTGQGRPDGTQGAAMPGSFFEQIRQAVMKIAMEKENYADQYEAAGDMPSSTLYRNAYRGLQNLATVMGRYQPLAASVTEGPGISFFVSTANEKPDREVEETLVHEVGIHGWQYILDPTYATVTYQPQPGLAPAWMKSRSDFPIIQQNLYARGYDDHALEAEAPAFILSGEWALLGYTGGGGFLHAVDFATEYLKRAIDRHPDKAAVLDRLMKFISPVFGKVLEDVQDYAKQVSLRRVGAGGNTQPGQGPGGQTPPVSGGHPLRQPAAQGRPIHRPGEAGAYSPGARRSKTRLPEGGQGGYAPGTEGTPGREPTPREKAEHLKEERDKDYEWVHGHTREDLYGSEEEYLEPWERGETAKSEKQAQDVIRRFADESGLTARYLARLQPGEDPGPELRRIAAREGIEIPKDVGPKSNFAHQKSQLANQYPEDISDQLLEEFPERVPPGWPKQPSKEAGRRRGPSWDAMRPTYRLLLDSEAYRLAHLYPIAAFGGDHDDAYQYYEDKDPVLRQTMRKPFGSLSDRDIERRLNEPITWDDEVIDEDKKAPRYVDELSIATRVGTHKFKLLFDKFKQEVKEQKRMVMLAVAPESAGPSGRAAASLMRDMVVGHATGDTNIANYLLGMEGVSDLVKFARRIGILADPRAKQIAVMLGQKEQLEPKVKEYLGRMPVQARYDFVDAIETGNIPSLPSPLKEYAELIRRLLDERRDAIQDLGIGKLKHFREHYLPRILVHPKNFGLKLKPGRRPVATRKTFLKTRLPGIDTLKDVMALGYTPITDNPIDWLSAKLAEMDRYVGVQRVLKEGRERGYIHRIRGLLRKPPKYYEALDPSVGLIYTVDPKTGATVVWGRWIAPAPFARVINNWVSIGLEISPLYRGLRWVNNAMNQNRLGLSGFHAGMTTWNAAFSVGAMAWQRFIYAAKDAPASARGFQRDWGEMLGAAGQMAYALTSIPPAMQTGYLGRKVSEAMHDPSKHPEMQATIEALKKGGAVPHQDRVYVNAASRSFLGAIQDLKKDKDFYSLGATLFKLPFAFMEQTNRPIMEYLVPYMKLGAAYQLMALEMKRLGPNPSVDEERAVARLVWDTIDDRFGQLVYDNLFWHKIVKDIAMLAVQSVAWKLGSLRLGIGGVKDFAKLLANMGAHAFGKGEGLVPPGGGGRIPPRKPPPRKPGSPPPPPPPPRGERPGIPGEPLPWTGGDFESTYRIGYLIWFTFHTAVIGALMTVLVTGKYPHGRDYFAPPDGTKDEYGKPNRFQLSTYWKDILRFYRDPYKYATSSMGPLISSLIELWDNEDFYGNQIITRHASFWTQVQDFLWFALNANEPYSFRNYQVAKERGASLTMKAMQFFGQTSAPASEVQSAAERVGVRNIAEKGLGARPKQDQARYELMRRLIREKRMGGDVTEKLDEAEERGVLSGKDIRMVEQSGSGSRLQALFKMQTAEGAIQMWDAATPAERRELRDLLDAKIKGVSKGPGQRANLLTPQMEKRLGQMPEVP